MAVDTPFAREGINLIHAPLDGYLDMTSVRELASFLQRLKPEDSCVVHTHRYRDAFSAIMARRLARRPDVKIVTTRHVIRRGRRDLFFRNIYKQVDAHIFVSQAALDAFSRHLPPPIDRNKIHVLNNSLNLSESANNGLACDEPARGAVTALYHGPIVKGKGLETLIDAFASLRGLKLRLRICGYGNPDYLDILRRRAMAASVMDAIDWNTRTPLSLPLCSENHFGVLPSDEREGFGMGNLMMMAAGRPQITTSHGAQNEYLTHEHNALFIPPGNVEELAAAMKRLCLDKELRLQLGQQARRDFNQNLGWERFISILNQIYDNNNIKK